jgi:hypothetical protein
MRSRKSSLVKLFKKKGSLLPDAMRTARIMQILAPQLGELACVIVHSMRAFAVYHHSYTLSSHRKTGNCPSLSSASLRFVKPFEKRAPSLRLCAQLFIVSPLGGARGFRNNF